MTLRLDVYVLEIPDWYDLIIFLTSLLEWLLSILNVTCPKQSLSIFLFLDNNTFLFP